MNLHKRIGVLMGRIYKNINKQLLEGIVEQAQTEDFSIYVFTLNEECANEKIVLGEENLFSLIQFSLLDGIIFAPYTFASAQYQQYIEDFLLKNCNLPVVRIGIEQEHFIPVWYDDRKEMSEIVLHLIYRHGCKKILCLTGLKMLAVARNRAEGYRDAMEQAGLPYTDEDIIFGDFWINSSRELASEIADGLRPKPDAVVCANDTMAIALCDALSEKGIRVPEEIRVTGYDGYTETRIHIPAVTTYQTSLKQLGRNAVCRLYQEITGEIMTLCGNDTGQLLCRESCGCNSGNEKFNIHEFDYQQFEESFIDCTLSAALHDVSSLNGFIENMYSMLFKFMDGSRFASENLYLCLCNDWDNAIIKDDSRIYRTKGYSEKMLFIRADCERISFASFEMLPEFLHTDKSTVVFFTAAHFQERCFGYICLETDGILDDFNVNYIRFCREVNNGLAFLCSQNELKRLAYRKYLSESRDELTGMYLLENCPQMWEEISETAELYGRNIYLIIISPGGLKHIENAEGSAESDKYFVLFADMLARCCCSREQIFRIGEKGFIIIGTEQPPVLRPEQFLKALAEQFRQQHVISAGQHMVYVKQETKIISESETLHFEQLLVLIKELLKKLSSISSAGICEKMHYQELTELRREIFLHPEKEWNGTECSRKLNMSKSYFHKLYRQIFSINFTQDVQQSRLSYAKKLLLTTMDTLQDIAEKCGYDYSNFMRVFKKETGMTPTQFRKG